MKINSILLNSTPEQFCRETGACPEGTAFALGCATMHEVWEKCPVYSWLDFISYALIVDPEEYLQSPHREAYYAAWDMAESLGCRGHSVAYARQQAADHYRSLIPNPFPKP